MRNLKAILLMSPLLGALLFGFGSIAYNAAHGDQGSLVFLTIMGSILFILGLIVCFVIGCSLLDSK